MGNSCQGYCNRENIEDFIIKDEEEVEAIGSPADLEIMYQKLIASIKFPLPIKVTFSNT